MHKAYGLTDHRVGWCVWGWCGWVAVTSPVSQLRGATSQASNAVWPAHKLDVRTARLRPMEPGGARAAPALEADDEANDDLGDVELAPFSAPAIRVALAVTCNKCEKVFVLKASLVMGRLEVAAPGQCPLCMQAMELRTKCLERFPNAVILDAPADSSEHVDQPEKDTESLLPPSDRPPQATLRVCHSYVLFLKSNGVGQLDLRGSEPEPTFEKGRELLVTLQLFSTLVCSRRCDAYEAEPSSPPHPRLAACSYLYSRLLRIPNPCCLTSRSKS